MMQSYTFALYVTSKLTFMTDHRIYGAFWQSSYKDLTDNEFLKLTAKYLETSTHIFFFISIAFLRRNVAMMLLMLQK